MAMLKCAACGIQKEESGNNRVCPMCGGALISLEEELLAHAPAESSEKSSEKANYVFIPEVEQAKLYEIAQPAVADDNLIEAIREPLREYVKQLTAVFSDEVFRAIWGALDQDIESSIRSRTREADQALKAAINASKKLLASYDTKSSGLGFSIITNSATSAAAYVGLTALDAKMAQGRAQVAAIDEAKKVLNSIKSSEMPYYIKSILGEIDKTIERLKELHVAKEFVQQYKAFYVNHAQNDIGIFIAETNVFKLLSAAANGNCGFLGVGNKFFKNKSYQEQKAILIQLASAGYIKILDYSYYTYDRLLGRLENPYLFYVTTGKYEDTLLNQKLKKIDPQAAAAEEQRKAAEYTRAEESFAKGKYYEAATSFACLEGYRDALQRSIQIWVDKLCCFDREGHSTFCISDEDSHSAQYVVRSNGIVRHNKGLNPNLLKTRYKQIMYSFVSGNNIRTGVTFEGELHDVSSGISSGFYDIRPGAGGFRGISKIIADDNNCPLYIYTGGTVRGPEKYATQLSAINKWSKIVDATVCRTLGDVESIAGLKEDGTVCASGKLAAFSMEYEKWKGIKKIRFSNYGRILLGLTSDNRVYAAGPQKEKERLEYLLNRTDIVDITRISLDTCLGLTTNGTLVAPDNKEDVFFAWCKTLRGVVAARSVGTDKYLALRADGTIVSYGLGEIFSKVRNAVAIIGKKIVCADGSILNTDGKTLTWKIFDHIDTIREERIQGLQEVIQAKKASTKGLKGLFADRDKIQSEISHLESEIAKYSKP